MKWKEKTQLDNLLEKENSSAWLFIFNIYGWDFKKKLTTSLFTSMRKYIEIGDVNKTKN